MECPKRESQQRDGPAHEVDELRRRLAESERMNASLEQRIAATGNRQMAQIVESAIDYAIIGMDLDGIVTSWNEGARRLLGWTESEMTGQPASRFFTHEDRQNGIPQFEMQEALRHERGSDERWHLRKDGARFWANGEMMPLKDESGEIRGLIKILRDRTEQRLAAERQRADAEFLRRVLAASGDCIQVLDLDANLTFISEGGMRVMEIASFDAIRGRPWLDFFHGTLKTEAYNAVAAAKAGDLGQFQGFAPTMAGTMKYWDVQVTPILDAHEKPERLLAVSRDITASRRAEAQSAVCLELGDRLRDSEDADAMTRVAIAILTQAFDAAAAGFQRLTPGQGVVTIEQGGVPSSLSARHLHSLRQNQPVLVDGRIIDAAGSILVVPVLEHGALAAFFFITRDEAHAWTPDDIAFAKDLVERTSAVITQWRTDQKMREMTASLERQVEQRTLERDRIWRVSRDLLAVASELGVWAAINPAWTATLGWSEKDIVGNSYEWLLHPDDLPTARSELERVTSGQPINHFECRLKTTAGDYRWISWSAVLVEGSLYCVGRDVTIGKQQSEALRIAEEQLRQSQKMEAVGQLTGGLAHDFNNLLTGISGSLELLKLRMTQGRLDQAERYISTAEGAAKRAAALTHRLLTFSRQQPLDSKPTHANRLIQDMKDLIQRTVGPEIKIETKFAVDLWITLCDPNQLENAILNLAINARDAMPDGGNIEIETKNIAIGEHTATNQDMKPGAYIVISVADTGIGMTPDVVARAFDPFFTTKPQGRGTGLGLSMIYGFAKQSGGQVRIASAPGQGTTVRLYLPRHLGEAEHTSSPAQSAPGARARDGDTILIVDDEPTVRMLVTDLLEELGYTVIAAADGNTGLATIYSGTRIDLLITDVGLPGGVNGRQLAQVGLARRPNLKVLFVTGYPEDAATRSGQLRSGMAVLVKPFAMDALLNEIKRLIAGN